MNRANIIYILGFISIGIFFLDFGVIHIILALCTIYILWSIHPSDSDKTQCSPLNYRYFNKHVNIEKRRNQCLIITTKKYKSAKYQLPGFLCQQIEEGALLHAIHTKKGNQTLSSKHIDFLMEGIRHRLLKEDERIADDVLNENVNKSILNQPLLLIEQL